MILKPKMQVVQGDLLDFATPFSFIAHQCNCKSNTPKNLSKQIFTKFPRANIYKRDVKRTPGTIIVRGSVINMLSQNHFGKAYGNPDTYEMRRQWLRSCLQQILAIPTIKVVYFPWGLGCGLAGDNWDEVRPIIEEFGEEMTRQGRQAAFVLKIT